MNMINAASRKKERQEELERQKKEKALDSSPIRTVLGSLALGGKKKATTKKNERTKQISREPYKIEEVPFSDNKPHQPTNINEVPLRRQDRRTLNARNRRIMDRKLICCIIFTGSLLMGLGGACLAVYFAVDEPGLKPLIIVGPVLLAGSLVTWLLSIEICIRLSKNNKRTTDPELDKLVNLHEIKHWMDPILIPFGWGLFEEGDEVVTIDKVTTNKMVGGV
ncbi:uncharacterized protein LOC111710259, partial [Eurytemora carolleeae]|uniref:uncharacterized protein LOC111710259 n=1 Tax=Eurytemora carolleeae TaxID=1294199 RepID=UPI000C7939B5